MFRALFAISLLVLLSACTTIGSEAPSETSASSSVSGSTESTATQPQTEPDASLTTAEPTPSTTSSVPPSTDTSSAAPSTEPSGPVFSGFAAAKPTIEIKKPKDGKTFDGEVVGGVLGASVDLDAKTQAFDSGPMTVRWEVDGVVVATGDKPKDVWIPRGTSDQFVTITAIGSLSGIDVAQDQVTIAISPSIEIKKPKDGDSFPGETNGSGDVGAFIDLDADTDPLDGDTMTVRWEVDGTVVATGTKPKDVWIPRTSTTTTVTAIGTVNGVDVAFDSASIVIWPKLEIKKPKDGKTEKGEVGPSGGLGAYLDLDADTDPVGGDTMTVRWEVDGAVVATGTNPKDVWIPRSGSDQHVTIIAIGTVNGVDVALDQVTIEITPSIEIKKPDDNVLFEGTYDPVQGTRGAFVELDAKTKPLPGGTMTVRWEVDGVVVATGESPGNVWIPSTSDVDAVTIVAIGIVNGDDVAIDQVTVVIFAPSN